jgi:uroporphyrin-3 C-methyltransferase
MTDKKKPLDNDQKSTPVVKYSHSETLSSSTHVNKSNKSHDKTSSSAQVDNKDAKKETMKTNTMKSSKETVKSIGKKSTDHTQVKAGISKTALSALFIAILSATSVGGHFYWQEQQTSLVKRDLLQKNTESNQQIQQQVQRLLAAQKQSFSVQLEKMVNKVQTESMTKIAQLETTVTRLSQNKPSDWLIHEAEYLVRIAARTMWLERDTQAAIGLLKDADSRLNELNDPNFLPVRQLIYQDIEQLRLMPSLNSEKTILVLMGLNQQITNLPLAIVDIDNQSKKNTEIELSSDIADWQENLAKSWRKFLDTFVVIHSRDGKLEPLLSPSQQKNLRENLSLKLQQAQWAVREEKTAIYQQTLIDIQDWLTHYFDMTDKKNQHFISEIQALKTETISFDYPSTLSSLQGMRSLINQQTPSNYRSTLDKTISVQTIDDNVDDSQVTKAPDKADETPKEKINKAPQITIEEQLQQQELKQRELDKKTNSSEDNL